ERKAGSGGTYSEIARLGESLSYVDTGLSANTTYYYRVRIGSFDSSIWSPYSSEISVTTANGGADIPLNNLMLWLRADAGAPQKSQSSTISSWLDQSGHGNDAVSPSGNNPVQVPQVVAGRPVVRFDGTGSYFNLPDFMSTATAG